MFRNDYTHNGNDSHWLTNPRQPLTGFARIIGDEGTRAQPAHAARARPGRGAAGRRPEVRLRGVPATLTLPTTASTRASSGATSSCEMCASRRCWSGTSGPVNVSEACPVLEAWDLRDDPKSRGRDPVPPLRDARARRSDPTGLSVATVRGPFSRPFDPADPVNTPSGLNTIEPAGARRAAPTRSTTCVTPASRSTRRSATTSTSSATARTSRSPAAPARSASSTRST